MTTLPASIEAYLSEAGFSSTEILVLKRLLEGEAMTLRELAAKTGKSTGVLDQATRKLLGKHILTKDTINGTPKFVVVSLKAIAEWMENDMRQKREVMQRKHKDFETFLSTLELDKGRPEMEYFEGREGIQQAFLKLLDRGDTWLWYTPAQHSEQEDPLCEFRVQLFRERRKRSVFARVIAPDTLLGKRFAARDVFEYRKTQLIPEHQMPVGFEKIIAGDTVACFNHAENRACFIRYGEMADSQKRLFEMLWCMGTGKSDEECAVVAVPADPPVSLETKTLSGLRDFFLSRKSLMTMGILAVLSAVITFGLYEQYLYQDTQRVREKVRAVAATASSTFDATDIRALRGITDMDSAVYKRVVTQLDYIRSQNPGVKYAYIVRPQSNGDSYEFVADADGLRIGQHIDFNGDGILGPEDEIPVPGMPYDVSEIPGIIIGMVEPVGMDETYTDQWGTFISGFSPIRDTSGKTVAVLGIDQLEGDIQALTKQSFVAVYWLVGLFILFMLIRLAAFNRSLGKELILMLRQQSTLFVLCLTIGLASLVTYGIYSHTSFLNLERIKEKTIAIAATSALQFTGEEVDQIRVRSDVDTAAYKSVVRRLMKIQQENVNVAFTYILRPSEEEGTYVFVAANDGLDPSKPFDSNGDGILTEADEIVSPGDPYDVTGMDALSRGAVTSAIANSSVYTDQWGTFLTAYAPILRKDGTVAGLFSVDVRVEVLKELNQKTFSPFLYFVGLFFIFVFVRLVGFHRNLTQNIFRLSRSKRVLFTLLGCGLVALCITYALYVYTLNLMKQEVGNRLMAIAATAAGQIDAEDLDLFRTAKDMNRQEYRDIFSKLNEVRNQNPNIKYVYIFRKMDEPEMLEFVADADSSIDLLKANNPNLEEVVPPGTAYFGGQLSQFKQAGEKVFSVPLASRQFTIDKWGVFISASAPIFYKNGYANSIIGLDMDVSDFYSITRQKFQYKLVFFTILTILILIQLIIAVRNNSKTA